MKNPHVVSLGLLGLAVSACGPTLDVEAQAEGLTSAPLCAGARYISYHTGGVPCPLLDSGMLSASWSARALFPAMPWETSAPGRLANYCVFEWAPSPASSTYPGAATLHSELTAALPIDAIVDQDCPNVHPQSGLLQSHWPNMQFDFRGRAGAVEAITSIPSDPRWVTVVDTSPDDFHDHWTMTTSDRGHGFGLARVMEDLTCDQGLPGSGCLLRTRSVAAFRSAPPVQLGQGPQPVGQHGYLSDLAAAVYTAARLDDSVVAASSLPQVINLSLGWVPISQLGGGIGDVALGEKAAAGAVHEALQYANCRDALVFAAAGNNHDGAGALSDAALYPAAWTTHASLDTADCLVEFGVPGGIGGRPIAQAVGAHQQDGFELASARRNGTPAFGAFSVRALAEAPGAVPTTPMNGSSVGTALVSAGAAALWSLAPHLAPDDVLDTLYLSGADTGKIADLHDGVRTSVRHIRPCEAVEEVCVTTGLCAGSCVALDPPTYDPRTLALASMPGAPTVCALPGTISPAPVCGRGSDPLDLRPHTVPQPGDVYCPVCDAMMGNNGYFDLVMEVKSGSYIDPLYVKLSDGMASYSLDITPYFSSSLAPNTTHTVKLGGLSIGAGNQAHIGAVYFDVHGGSQVSTVSTELNVY